MMLPITTGVLMFVAVLVAGLTGLARRNRPDEEGVSGSEEDWLERFSLESYRPMERLLTDSDYEYLASQPGYDPGIIHELRTEHRRIFRIYLHRLLRDFNELVHLAKVMAVESNEDRTDLMRAIFRLRLRFYWNVTLTELQLALAPLPLGRIDSKRLVGSLAVVRENIEDFGLPRYMA